MKPSSDDIFLDFGASKKLSSFIQSRFRDKPVSTKNCRKMAFKSALGLAAVNHQYSDEERQILNSYQSLEYLPPHSKV